MQRFQAQQLSNAYKIPNKRTIASNEPQKKLTTTTTKVVNNDSTEIDALKSTASKGSLKSKGSSNLPVKTRCQQKGEASLPSSSGKIISRHTTAEAKVKIDINQPKNFSKEKANGANPATCTTKILPKPQSRNIETKVGSVKQPIKRVQAIKATKNE